MKSITLGETFQSVLLEAIINFSIKNMSLSNKDLKTEELAKRHGKTTNQKCNFKYLMNNKIGRGQKSTTYRAKEN